MKTGSFRAGKVHGLSEDNDQQLAALLSTCIRLWDGGCLLVGKCSEAFTDLQETADSIMLIVFQNPDVLSWQSADELSLP